MNTLFDGPVHLPGDEAYEAHRRPLRPDLDPHPLLIIEAADVTDVRAAVLAARQRNLPFAVQATGHGTHVAADNALLLKTSSMGTLHIDPDRQVARVGAGVRWGDVLAAAAPHGLAPLSGSSPSVGVVGYTLGGGMGWLARKHGFAADSVTRAEIVTADGRALTATPDQYPDLFWAIRGGGGNFGVVTALEFKLYPIATVYAGTVTFPIERAGDILSAYREWAPNVPDAMSTAVVLRDRTVVVKVMYAGSASAARRHLRPLWTPAGAPLARDLRTMRYADAAMGGTAARYLDFFPKLTDSTLESVLAARVQTGSTVEIRHWGGAIARPTADSGPVGHRHAQFSIILDAPSASIADDLRPDAIGATFFNFLGNPERVDAAFTTDNLRRLRAVKKAYDPDNFFRLNHNIRPA